MLIRLGSRGSRLALVQADLAADALRQAGAGAEVASVPSTTAGARDRSKPFGEIGARGVFVKEIEEALLAGRIDVAVHSAKDMTSTDTEGLAVGAYPPREDPRDALCGAAELRPGMRVGTASVRRRAQLLSLEPTLSGAPRSQRSSSVPRASVTSRCETAGRWAEASPMRTRPRTCLRCFSLSAQRSVSDRRAELARSPSPTSSPDRS